MRHSFKEISRYMNECILSAKEALYHDEVPVGAVIVNSSGAVISRGYNKKETLFDVSAHAEIMALKKAGEDLKDWRMNDLSMFVSLEPCPMCLSAILQSRIKEVYFGAYDPKGGALSLGYNFHQDKRLNHQFNIYGGFLHYESSQILSNYFKTKRRVYSSRSN